MARPFLSFLGKIHNLSPSDLSAFALDGVLLELGNLKVIDITWIGILRNVPNITGRILSVQIHQSSILLISLSTDSGRPSPVLWSLNIADCTTVTFVSPQRPPRSTQCMKSSSVAGRTPNLSLGTAVASLTRYCITAGRVVYWCDLSKTTT